MQRISEHITWGEATQTNCGLENIPSETQLHNLIFMANRFFEPLRKRINKPIKINSMFRSGPVNNKVGGAKNSQHLALNGAAMDLEATSGMTNKELFDIIKNEFDFDQLINEFDYKWIHVSYVSPTLNRRQILST